MPVYINCITEVLKRIKRNTYWKNQLQGFYVPIAKIINKLNKKIGVFKIKQQAQIYGHTKQQN